MSVRARAFHAVFLAWIASAALAASCSPSRTTVVASTSTPNASTASTTSSTTSTAVTATSISPCAAPSNVPPPALEEIPLVTDAAALRVLEDKGARLDAMLDGGEAKTNDEEAKHPMYASIVKVLERDVAEAHAADPASGVGMTKGHRLLDTKTLVSHDARFELIGVATRLDRVFANPDACGEIRLLYRLAYATKKKDVAIASRLPVTMAVTFYAKTPGSSESCASIAARARAPIGTKGEKLAEWALHDGLLSDLDALRTRFRSVELNAQIVRWPSTLRPDMAGHAEYLLRVFRKKQGDSALSPSTLENTPDVVLLKKDAKLRAELLAWIRDEKNLRAIDAGTAVMPEKFLATRAVSVSPRGLARRQNRPFRQLFTDADVDGLSLSSTTYVTSKHALLRRLDEMSCPGCHQSRSVAGFHLLGEETAPASSPNAIAVAMSPHLVTDLARRKARLHAIATGATWEEHAFLAERSPEEAGTYGAHCGLGDAGFAKWTCADGLQCVVVEASSDDADVGACLPVAPADGDPCALGLVTPVADGHKDKVVSPTARACGGARFCEANGVGFPDGMCASACDALDATSVCAGIPVLVAFNDCLAQNVPFETCVAEHAEPKGVRACDVAHPCRDDYVCARTPDGKGACMPPYFLFQLRVDGHP